MSDPRADLRPFLLHVTYGQVRTRRLDEQHSLPDCSDRLCWHHVRVLCPFFFSMKHWQLVVMELCSLASPALPVSLAPLAPHFTTKLYAPTSFSHRLCVPGTTAFVYSDPVYRASPPCFRVILDRLYKIDYHRNKLTTCLPLSPV